MPCFRLLCLLGLLIATQAGCLRTSQGSDAGCDQSLPPIIEYAGESSLCDWLPPDSCALAGCGECQVCLVDIGCGPPDSTPDIASSCTCRGDGECYDMCAGDDECPGASRCIPAYWCNGYDSCSFAVSLCWPHAYQPFMGP